MDLVLDRSHFALVRPISTPIKPLTEADMKALGVTPPPALLAVADEVIE